MVEMFNSLTRIGRGELWQSTGPRAVEAQGTLQEAPEQVAS
jgi:hypothetical protein